MGQWLVCELSTFMEIEQITVAARNRNKYEMLLEKAGDRGNKLRFLEVDLNQNRASALSEMIKGHDLVASAAGPFYMYERLLAAAAVEAGAPYVSLCDDYDAAEQVFELDERARAKGLCVLTGMGWTPGLSSLLAKMGAASLDEVEKIKIYWAASSKDSLGLAVILHTMHVFTGKAPLFQDGSLRKVPAGSGRERVRFPEPIGEMNVYNVGHPEPVTMPRFFPGISEVVLKGGVNEDMLNRLPMITAKIGLNQIQGTRHLLAVLFQKTMTLLRKMAGPAAEVSGIRVVIEGFSGGSPSRRSYSVVGPMEIISGVPMTVAIRELARGRIEKTGVFSPEAPGALDSQVFFEELEGKGVKIIKEDPDGRDIETINKGASLRSG